MNKEVGDHLREQVKLSQPLSAAAAEALSPDYESRVEAEIQEGKRCNHQEQKN